MSMSLFKKHVYFDYNATSPLHPYVKDAYISALDIYGNPSSVHKSGREARRHIETARGKIASYCGVSERHVIFTSSATEANHLILRGNDCDALLVPNDEHDCVLAAAKASGKAIYPIALTEKGLLDEGSFDEALRNCLSKGQKPFMTAMKVNNETGIIKDLAPYAQKIRENGGVFHSDAVQAIGKLPFDDWAWQCDALTLSAHKVGGPKGIGCLIIKDNIRSDPLLTGGGQEMRRRAGTENIPAIIAFGAFMDIVNEILQDMSRLSQFKDQIIKYCHMHVDKVQPLFEDSPIVANTLSLCSKKTLSEKLVIKADLSSVQLSAGSACSSGKVKESHVLKSYSLGTDIATQTVRISMGFQNTQEDIDYFISVADKIF
ncbi:MAG: cysteine desulfurase family protein [Pseudomonadota bacterium]